MASETYVAKGYDSLKVGDEIAIRAKNAEGEPYTGKIIKREEHIVPTHRDGKDYRGAYVESRLVVETEDKKIMHINEPLNFKFQHNAVVGRQSK
jgi:hypothetical protein